MKKTIFTISLALAALLLLNFTTHAYANKAELIEAIASNAAISTEDAATAEEIAQEEKVSYQELEIETPKLLPNNPFYFIKKWNWGIKRIFTFNPVKRAELELRITNEQAAEMKRLEEVDPNNIKAIERAANNYNRNVKRLKNRLEAIKETSENPKIDKFLDKLADRSLKHQRLFDNLKNKLEKYPVLKEKLENIESRIDDVIVEIPEKFEDSSKFKKRIQRIIKKQPQRTFKELRAVEFLDRIEEKLPEDKKEYLKDLKEEMISKFESRAKKWNDIDKKRFLKPEILKRLPGDNIRRINILEKIGEKSTDSSFRARIQGVKSGLIKRIDPKASQERILKLIKQAKTLIVKVENLLSYEVNNKVAELLKRAKAHLVKANQALNKGKIGEAFGQARSAISTAKNALRKIQQRNGGGTVCPLIAPLCQAGKTAVKSIEKDEKGCPVLKCVTCPQYSPPLCKKGEKMVSSHNKNKIGCQGPLRCVHIEKEDNNAVKKGLDTSQFCIQVITPAISPRGVCKNFPTPCDVPTTWKKVNGCPRSVLPSIGTQNTTNTTNTQDETQISQ